MSEPDTQMDFSNSHEFQKYFTSSKSPLAKSRKVFWLSIAIGLGIGFLRSRGSMVALAISTAILMVVALPIDLIMRRKLSKREPAVVLSPEMIESRLFSGKFKRYRWNDIESISIDGNRQGRFLRFQLVVSPHWRNRRNFWTSANEAQPTIPLGSFEPADQEKMFDAISIHLLSGRRNFGSEAQSANPLREERAFLEKLNALGPTPWATYALIAINVVVWLATLSGGATIEGASVEKLLHWGGNAASEVQRGEWWRLVTAMFLHLGLLHLTMNMFGLASIGPTVERIYGRSLFLLIYCASGILGSALSLHFAAQYSVSVGASGAVFGTAGALLAGLLQHRRQLPKVFGRQTLTSLGLFVVYSLMQGFAHQGIDNAAHIGGLLGGGLLAWVLPVRLDLACYSNLLRFRATMAVVIAGSALYGLIATAPAAAVDQKRLAEANAMFEQGAKEFSALLEIAKEDDKLVKTGKRTKRESAELARTVLAPRLRQIQLDFAAVYLPTSDPRIPVLADLTQVTKLMLELAEMPSVDGQDSADSRPADPGRAAAIADELAQLGKHLQQVTAAAKPHSGNRLNGK